MKKEWKNPQMIQLGVEQTKGGPIYDTEPDGTPWFDNDLQKWLTPSGHS